MDLKELKWVQRDSRNDELVSGKEVLGKLQWTSKLRSLVTAESADGKWTFKRGGFLRPKITIREYGKDNDLYTANIGWNGEATLWLPDQGRFRWVPNIWHTKWTLMINDEKEIMSIQLDGFSKVSGNVSIEDTSVSIQTLSLLALLGWYLIIKVLSDDASSIGTAIPP